VLQDDTSTDAGEDGQGVLSGREIRKMLRCGAKNILASREKSEMTGLGEAEIDKIIAGAKELGSLLSEAKNRDQEEEEEQEKTVDVMELELFETRQVRQCVFICVYACLRICMYV
jgi:hypothetical protein